jgi:eukaryotic-like serine/threonine-protein kinase
MRIQCVKSAELESPGLVASKLPPQIVDRAVTGLFWITIFTVVTSILFTAVEHILQPEFAKAWTHPVLRITSLGMLFLSAGVMVVQRMGWLRKDRLLDLGLFFQMAIAFAVALFEAAAYENPDAVVVGHSGIAVWMLLCGLLMPQAPLRAALSASLCVLMWPLAYWVDLKLFGYQPMPLTRLLVWILPLAIIGVWMYILNNRVLSLYIKQQRAEDIGSYVLDSRLASGGMGEVWIAKHKMLARDAAIKLIRPEMLKLSTGRQEALLRKRFEREAQVTASLRSPHTVALYDFGQATDGSFYYVMELLDGIDLQTMVDKYGPLDPGRVIHVLTQTCKSLEEAHRASLIHRDIKPKNIMLSKMGLEYDFAKVLDFGLVKSVRLAGQEESLLTMEGVTTGTPAYLSPEIALGARDIDGRADLYSLGCVAYFLLTGGMVFEEASPTAFAIAHAQTPPTPMSERSELPIPAGLEAIVMQLLEKDPAQRIQSAGEVARRLRALRDIPQWCPDRAAQWWETNVPSVTASQPAAIPLAAIPVVPA